MSEQDTTPFALVKIGSAEEKALADIGWMPVGDQSEGWETYAPPVISEPKWKLPYGTEGFTLELTVDGLGRPVARGGSRRLLDGAWTVELNQAVALALDALERQPALLEEIRELKGDLETRIEWPFSPGPWLKVDPDNPPTMPVLVTHGGDHGRSYGVHRRADSWNSCCRDGSPYDGYMPVPKKT